MGAPQGTTPNTYPNSISNALLWSRNVLISGGGGLSFARKNDFTSFIQQAKAIAFQFMAVNRFPPCCLVQMRVSPSAGKVVGFIQATPAFIIANNDILNTVNTQNNLPNGMGTAAMPYFLQFYSATGSGADPDGAVAACIQDIANRTPLNQLSPVFYQAIQVMPNGSDGYDAHVLFSPSIELAVTIPEIGVVYWVPKLQGSARDPVPRDYAIGLLNGAQFYDNGSVKIRVESDRWIIDDVIGGNQLWEQADAVTPWMPWQVKKWNYVGPPIFPIPPADFQPSINPYYS